MKVVIGFVFVIFLLAEAKGCEDCYKRNGVPVQGVFGYTCAVKR